jgi:hypothetical protein
MEIIKELKNELRIKIEESRKTQNEELEFYILDLTKKILKEYKNKYKLNMIYNNIDV